MMALRSTAEWLATTSILPRSGGGFDINIFCVDGADVAECGLKFCLAGWYIVQHPGCGLLLQNYHVYLVDGDSVDSYDALAQHFDIPLEMAQVLFNPSGQGELTEEGWDNTDRVVWARQLIARLDFLEKKNKRKPFGYGLNLHEMCDGLRLVKGPVEAPA